MLGVVKNMKLKQIIKNFSKKVIPLSIAFCSLIQTKVFADPQSALTAAKSNLVDQIKPIVNTVVVPVIATVLVAVALILIAKAVIEYRKGRDVEIGAIVLVIAGIILVTTFPTWGWLLIS